MTNLRTQILIFFIALLLVGTGFWYGGHLLTKQLLSFSYRTIDKLQVDTFPQVLITLDFKIVDLKIDAKEKFTQVEIKTTDSMLKRLELEISNSQFSKLAIAKAIGLEDPVKKLEINQQVQVKIPLDLTAIKTRIQKEQGLSLIEVRTANHAVKKLNFVLPITELKILESAIAQLLNLSLEDVRKLTSYQVKDSSYFPHEKLSHSRHIPYN
ncbi:hypothetical protein CLI64_15525 [Nostoc sp. CENA543]|uniref:hypothetical protein n=1 Tax=Nostoc sp. CENA543 TaxID=1869241 RepID=UPI000CA0FD91|nr:hypothetical protein [Nostoc sp. CENA543]AUT01680.1 hypothetical protein CLI64_15525 [Nostoc sp. CENA543]